MMTIKEVVMRDAGSIINKIFKELVLTVHSGIRLKEIDIITSNLLKDNKAKSGLKLQGFPSHIAVSLNEQVIQGIPDNKVISEGDIVSLDMTLFYKGFFVDKAITFTVDPSHYIKRYLVASVQQCFNQALLYINKQMQMHKTPMAWTIGDIIEKQAKTLGLCSSSSLSGHGIGEEPHMLPIIPNIANKEFDEPLKPGMYIAIEPIIFYSKNSCINFDNLTVTSPDLSAHWEETIFLTNNGAEVLT